MTADELVSLVRKTNEHKKRLEAEALAIAHAVVEKALNPPPFEDREEVVKDYTREILLKKYHARKPEN